MKIIARKGITIVYAKRYKDDTGHKRQVVDHIPPDRDAFIVFKDQFGTVHGAGFGSVSTDQDDPAETIDQFVVRSLEHFRAPIVEDEP